MVIDEALCYIALKSASQFFSGALQTIILGQLTHRQGKESSKYMNGHQSKVSYYVGKILLAEHDRCTQEQ